MKIASLAPALTEIIHSFGLDGSLAAVSHECAPGKEAGTLPRVTVALAELPRVDGWRSIPALNLAVDAGTLAAAKPDLILCSPDSTEPPSMDQLRTLADDVGEGTKITAYAPRTLEQIYGEIERLGRICEVPSKGSALIQRMRAQFLDWGDSFYERMKNKRMTVISSIEPLKLAGLWVPDLIELASCISQVRAGGHDDHAADWGEIVEFRPDVIVVAPRDFDLQASMRCFKTMERFPEWNALPAVKRGEVTFCSGKDYFYRPSGRLISSMAILMSAAAGFDSGYIIERDTFYRLRWLELQRHRF